MCKQLILPSVPVLSDYAPDALYAFTGHAKRLSEARSKLEAAFVAHLDSLAEELKVSSV